MKNYYGKGISFYRIINRIKQAELAEYLDMSRQNLSEIENERRKISREKMVIAANKLGTTPEDIEVKSGIRTVYNNQNQQGEQYNNCTVAVPESLLATIQLTLQTLHKALSESQALNTELQLEIKQLKEGFVTFKDQYQKLR